MFKQLSQLGKNLTDELAKGLTDELNEGQFDKNSDIPVEVQAKLRKFEKYEQKYPLLLNAYKSEKAKSEKLAAVQKILSENTPISSIDDYDSLTSFFKNTNLKTVMLNDEIKRLTSEKNEHLREIQDLRAQKDVTADKAFSEGHSEKSEGLEQVKQLEQKVSEYLKDIETLKDELAAREEEKYAFVKQQTEMKNQIESLKGESTDFATALKSLAATEKLVDEFKKKLDSERQEHTKLNSELTKLEDEAARKSERIESLEKLIKSEEEDEALTKQDHVSSGTSQTSTSKSKKKKKKGKSQNTSSNSKVLPPSPLPGSSADQKSDLDNRLQETLKDLQETQEKLKVIQSEYDDLVAASGNSESLQLELEKTRGEIEKLEVDNERLLRELQESKKELKFKSEEVENVKDLLKTVGSELVEAKDTIKNSNGASETEMKHLKSQLESLRSQNSENIKSYETTQSELKQKVASLQKEKSETEKELDDLRTTLNKHMQEKSKLLTDLKQSHEKMSILNNENITLSDQVKNLNALKRSESSLRSSLLQKEKTIVYLEQQVKEYSSKEEASSRALREAKMENGRLSNKISLVSKECESLKNELEKSKTSLEKFIKENGGLSERLEVLNEKYETLQDMKTNSHEQVELIRRQCDELNVKIKELNKKNLSLEDELNESVSALQERTQEASSMRRLLAERQSDKDFQVQKLEQSFAAASEEKNRLESELALHDAKTKRTINELKEVNDDLREQVQTLIAKEKDYEQKVARLTSLNKEMQTTRNESSQSSIELKEALANVKAALMTSEKKLREMESSSESIKELNDDLTKKLERISKNYKLVSGQLATIKERSVPSRGPSRSNSVLSISDRASNEPSSRRGSFNGETVIESQSEINDKIAYIKNVLLGFLEHKDQRDQLLPVVSTLLQLDSNDEKRLMAIR